MAGAASEEATVQYISRDHSTWRYVFILVSISMCITVDILQYSMPLAFLPSVLEDRGHSPLKIATAIGVYYWTGLLGGLILTSYQIWKFLYVPDRPMEVTPYLTVRRQIQTTVFCLGIGVLTLFVQAWSPRWHIHTACRFVQGFVGAFLFFYVFLLAVAVFKGQQQVVAMTLVSCATVLAELAGPLLGSLLFDSYGQRAVFWFLGVVSILNQAMLVGVLFVIRPVVSHPAEAPEAACRSEEWWLPQPGAWSKMKALLQDSTFICACLIITMAGVIKGSVEEMLPFHADHQWHYDPTEIGKLFCTTAIAYFAASFIVAQFWIGLGRRRIDFGALCIFALGVTAWMCFHVAYYYKDEYVLFSTFASYGFCAGLTFTAAAQLIAEVVDRSEGHAKDVANGLWNSMWELGGSSGFFLGGYLAHRYSDQMLLTTRFLVCALLFGVCMAVVARTGGEARRESKAAGGGASYGSVA